MADIASCYTYSSMPSLGVKRSLPLIMRPTIVASLRMHCLLAIFLSILEASSLACERDLIMAEVYHKLWYILTIISTLQCVVNLREQKQSFVSAVSGHLMAGALMGSSSNWRVQKIAEAVNQNWMVILDAVLGRFSQQQDFRDQKGQLQEVIEAANHLIIFYPKFHCELNFIERFWCAAKWYARENCEYSLEGLRKIVPAALDSVFGCLSIGTVIRVPGRLMRTQMDLSMVQRTLRLMYIKVIGR